ncbi:hypothetical protein A1507_04720 [Methylomonas koyamae]|uniref:Uncharacterized protein n=1 Tax=Methylomonas koyamae TaxID=702114 RepID=A0A177NSB2_9GAMM|nr:hypothetical protein A1507_04720 [Methylomonas koyamae]
MFEPHTQPDNVLKNAHCTTMRAAVKFTVQLMRLYWPAVLRASADSHSPPITRTGSGVGRYGAVSINQFLHWADADLLYVGHT